MSAGFCWPSSSRVGTQSALVAAMPAKVAGCRPKFRESQTSNTKGNRAASASITTCELSIAPSWTRTTSTTWNGRPCGVSCGVVRGAISASRRSSVRSPWSTGTTIDSRWSSGAATSWPDAAEDIARLPPFWPGRSSFPIDARRAAGGATRLHPETRSRRRFPSNNTPLRTPRQDRPGTRRRARIRGRIAGSGDEGRAEPMARAITRETARRGARATGERDGSPRKAPARAPSGP